jgi:hypothetical protein
MSDELRMPEAVSLHGGSVPAGMDAAAGRYGRMFGLLPVARLSNEAIEGLVTVIADRGGALGENPAIPAGYTYLGQFVDHDITFDPTSELDRLNDPRELVNVRTPRLDLDSVYGGGPKVQPFLYDWATDLPHPGVRLLVGKSAGALGEPAVADLPRTAQGRAIIGDPRNDVHLIIAQLHLLFIRFHNKVVGKLAASSTGVGLDDAGLFRAARQIVQWHYQWIVVKDFLDKVAGSLAAGVLGPDLAWPAVQRRFFHWDRAPYIPVEFSAAAFRFGHSMVRDSYTVRKAPEPAAPAGGVLDKALDDLLVSTLGVALVSSGGLSAKLFPKGENLGPETHLTGFRDLPPKLEIQWPLFFEVNASVTPQSSRRIDTGLALRLSTLPGDVSAERVLPRANLLRGRALGLPSGRDVALTMGETPLTAEQLHLGADAAIGEKLRSEILAAVPLWYYVLSEAEALHEGARLGPVGGRIVAEVLVGLLEGDPESFLRQTPRWTPARSAELLGRDPATADDFTMADLVRFAES